MIHLLSETLAPASISVQLAPSLLKKGAVRAVIAATGAVS